MSLAVFHSSTALCRPVLKNNSPMQESVDPSFYLYVEKISLEKLRREERRFRASTPSNAVKAEEVMSVFKVSKAPSSPSSGTTVASETRFKLAAAKSEDIRWRTFVKLSYQKAKICARLVKGHRNSLKPGAVPPSSLPSPPPSSSSITGAAVLVAPTTCPYKNSQSANSCCDITSTDANAELFSPPPPQQQRRVRSRSDAFIVRPGHWRPDVNLFLSLSAPARLPSPVGFESLMN